MSLLALLPSFHLALHTPRPGKTCAMLCASCKKPTTSLHTAARQPSDPSAARPLSPPTYGAVAVPCMDCGPASPMHMMQGKHSEGHSRGQSHSTKPPEMQGWSALVLGPTPPARPVPRPRPRPHLQLPAPYDPSPGHPDDRYASLCEACNACRQTRFARSRPNEGVGAVFRDHASEPLLSLFSRVLAFRRATDLLPATHTASSNHEVRRAAPSSVRSIALPPTPAARELPPARAFTLHACT